jgi:hypothetical protein
MNANDKRRWERVAQAAEAALSDKGYMSPIDVFVSMDLLAPQHLESWRKGHLRYLEAAIQGNLSKISKTMAFFRKWARNRNLKPSETAYVRRVRRPKRELRFSKSGAPAIERAYRTHYVSLEIVRMKQEKQRERH